MGLRKLSGSGHSGDWLTVTEADSPESVNWGRGDDNGKGNGFWDNDESLKEGDKKSDEKTTRRRIVEELYTQATGKKPENRPENELYQEMLPYLQKLTGEKNVKIVVVRVRINPNDPTNSYAAWMKHLDRFLNESKGRFLDAAISHLGELDSAKTADRDKLCDALVKARDAGHLKESHDAALADLSERNPELGDALRKAGYQRTSREAHHANENLDTSEGSRRGPERQPAEGVSSTAPGHDARVALMNDSRGDRAQARMR